MSPRVRVLLVDDDEDCRIIYSTALEAAGFAVAIAENGAEGVQMARELQPDVILLDIAMPVMDGRAAVRALKADVRTRMIPTVAVTAVASLHTRGDLAADGFDAVLPKPVAPAVVVTAVRQATEARPSPDTAH
jgi:CheY-like chemotaxis protein